VTDDARAVVSMVQMFNQAATSSVQRFSRIFAANFPERFTLEVDKSVVISGRATPVLKSGSTVVNGDFGIPDRFTEKTGVSATIFVRSDTDFVRIATSVKKENGERAVGTVLEHAHPSYALLMSGQSYEGLAQLFGKQFITAYRPISDAAGKVIGVLYVGIDISPDIAALKDKIKALKVGETGYFYVLNARPGKELGNVLIHPVKEGQNILDAKDSDGQMFVRTMLANKEGVIRYPWTNPEKGEHAPREKIVAYQEFKEWGWLIAGGAYTAEITSAFDRLRNLTILGVVGALLLLALALYLIIRQIVTRPLTAASALAKRLAAGDLSTTLQTSQKDEIGELIGSMNGISKGLAQLVSGVRQSCEQIASASSQIAAGNQDLSSRTEQQAASLEETASSMQELTTTVRQNADNANLANQLVRAASEVAGRGGAIVAEVVSTMDAINQSSRRIVDIISVIDGIAFQTNILALNAAVEAARAGEQGRGFAVVATEVRSLAARSASAAREIKDLIGDSVKKIHLGSELVGQTGGMMEEVLSSVAKVTDIMREISAASREQSGRIDQVNSAISHIDDGTQHNAALVEEAAAAAASLEQQAAMLVQAVQAFKLGK